ncbi:MAG: ATP-binding cassette domain-containing protein, partial [Pseudomonadota bacterium]
MRTGESGTDPAGPLPEQALLAVENLSVTYGNGRRPVRVISNISFAVGEGEALGVVGESGCGKSQTMLAVLRLLPHGGTISRGSVRFGGRDLLRLSAREMRRVRGRGIALVSQDALSALNPTMTIGTQIAEPLVHDDGMSWASARARSAELLGRGGIAGPRAPHGGYPHQVSGGMRQ